MMSRRAIIGNLPFIHERRLCGRVLIDHDELYTRVRKRKSGFVDGPSSLRIERVL